MGAYSTLNVTREKAKQVLLAELASDHISDEALGQFMDSYLEPRLYNCRVVPDGWEYNDDDEV